MFGLDKGHHEMIAVDTVGTDELLISKQDSGDSIGATNRNDIESRFIRYRSNKLPHLDPGTFFGEK